MRRYSILSRALKHEPKNEPKPCVQVEKVELMLPQKSTPPPETLFLKQKVKVESTKDSKLLLTSVIGPANAGKSSLVNALCRNFLTPSSRLAHSTREKITCINTENNIQIVFTDTPGLVSKNHASKVSREVVTCPLHEIETAKHMLAVLDASKLSAIPDSPIDHFFLRKISEKNVTFVLNKIDTLNPTKQQKVLTIVPDAFLVSAHTGAGIDDLRIHLQSLSEFKEHIYPKEQQHDTPPARILEQLVRQGFFNRIHGYIPYLLKQKTVHWDQNESLRIVHEVYVQRDAHEKIIVGAGGKIIKGVSLDVQTELERFLNIKVHLYIDVKVKK